MWIQENTLRGGLPRTAVCVERATVRAAVLVTLRAGIRPRRRGLQIAPDRVYY
jgi:hypothetical protein